MSFYRKIGQIFGYPSFIDRLFFAAYFQRSENYSSEQRAFARRNSIKLLKLSYLRKPDPNSQYNIEKVPLRGGKNELYLREKFGKEILNLEKDSSIIKL